MYPTQLRPQTIFGLFSSAILVIMAWGWLWGSLWKVRGLHLTGCMSVALVVGPLPALLGTEFGMKRTWERESSCCNPAIQKLFGELVVQRNVMRPRSQ